MKIESLNDTPLVYLIVYLPDIEVSSARIEINIKAGKRNKSSIQFILKSCWYYIWGKKVIERMWNPANYYIHHSNTLLNVMYLPKSMLILWLWLKKWSWIAIPECSDVGMKIDLNSSRQMIIGCYMSSIMICILEGSIKMKPSHWNHKKPRKMLFYCIKLKF